RASRRCNGQRAIANTPAQASAGRNLCSTHTPSATRTTASTTRAIRCESAGGSASGLPGGSRGSGAGFIAPVHARRSHAKLLASPSLELVGDLADARPRANLILIAARRAGDAGGADHFIAGFDRQRALSRDYPREVHGSHRGIVLDPLDKLAGR